MRWERGMEKGRGEEGKRGRGARIGEGERWERGRGEGREAFRDQDGQSFSWKGNSVGSCRPRV